MKKITLFFVLISIVASSFAQLTLGGHFAYNSTWLINKQVFDAGAEMDVAASFGNYYGLIAGYYFSDQFGIETNINFNKLEQKYEGSIKYPLTEDRNSYDASTVLNTLDIPILMKFGKTSYFELGPMLQFVNKGIYNLSFDETGSFVYGVYNGYQYPIFGGISNEINKAVKSNFKSMGFGVSLGFGANFNIIEDVLKFNFGLRFNYILSDMEGINALGETKESVYIPADEKESFKTNPLYGGLKVGLVYIFE